MAPNELIKHSVDEVSSIAKSIDELTFVSVGIAAAVEEQTVITREIAGSIQLAAKNTAQASQEIYAFEEFAQRSGASVDEIA